MPLVILIYPSPRPIDFPETESIERKKSKFRDVRAGRTDSLQFIDVLPASRQRSNRTAIFPFLALFLSLYDNIITNGSIFDAIKNNVFKIISLFAKRKCENGATKKCESHRRPKGPPECKFTIFQQFPQFQSVIPLSP